MDLASHHPHHHDAAVGGGLARLLAGGRTALAGVAYLTPLLDFGIRLLLASVFFSAGLTKIASWDATLYLFENDYAVPFLPPEVAAYLGTAVELGIPVLLALGLGTRFAVVILFVFNIVAATSYPDLSPAGLKDHQYWGILMLVALFHGPGKLSLDHLIRRKLYPEVTP